ncbi:sulfite exporter TauE/SafE family protein [Streptomyces sp. ME02-8801-2C]|uniref:sulfite exporter TauE/SafE family protein n=1 Tax=Streptomyces sp. ME02-8801-2C TaxID=3028680 RepID=UPI0029B0FF90|nr:sulfite exporter TauE/SafE family protein [Streptomyces sp. ME02-8801-2C]MDX3452638.1 sulfite exporter TauE/SafE family protein [Streptomyces sp. ME02-8801-2C]
MDIWQAVAITVAAIAAGALNAVVGSGTLITFPTLLAFGYPPVLANVSNNLGLIPGVLSAAYGYRRELEGQRRRLVRLGLASATGGLLGALLLLELPADAFESVVPLLILAACVLILLQPRLNRRLREKPSDRENGGPAVWLGVAATGVYGGYFGAAQGVLLIGLLGSFLHDSLRRLNATKTVLAAIVNSVAALVFLTATDIDWTVAGLIAVGSTLGGVLGARLGRRLPPTALRVIILTVGITAAVAMTVR